MQNVLITRWMNQGCIVVVTFYKLVLVKPEQHRRRLHLRMKTAKKNLFLFLHTGLDVRGVKN